MKMKAETEMKSTGKNDEPAWSSDASPSSRRAVRFENAEDVSECEVRREKGFSPTENNDQNAAYLRALRELSTEKQKRRRKEKNMLKLAQELGNRTEQVAAREKQLEAMRSEIRALKKKLFESKNEGNEQRDEPGSSVVRPHQTNNRLPLSPMSSQDEVKRLENELDEKTQESKILEQNLLEQSKALEILQSDVSAKSEALQSLEAERERTEMVTLREHISTLEMTSAQHVQEKNDAICRMRSLEIDLATKDDLLLKQSASLESSSSENQMLAQVTKAEVMELRETLKLTQASFIKLGEDAANHEQVLRNLNTEMAQKDESILSMQTELAKEKEEAERLIALNKKLEEEKASMRYDLEGATNEILSLKANLVGEEHLLQERRRKEADFAASVQTNADSLRLLQEECISKDAKLDMVMAELVHERSILKAAEERRHLLEAECKALRIAKDLSEQQNDTLKDKINQIKASAMVDSLADQNRGQLQTSVNGRERAGSVTGNETTEEKDRRFMEQVSRIESLESSRQGLLDDCNFLRLSLNKLEEENRCLLLKFEKDEKSFADIGSRIQSQQKEANHVREELLACKIEVQRLVDNNNDCGNGLASAEKLLATHAKNVSDMLADLGSMSRTMENISRLKLTVEGLQQDLTKRDEKIFEIQKGLDRLASKDFTVPKANEKSEKGQPSDVNLSVDVLKQESQQSLESASENLSCVLSDLAKTQPSCAKLQAAVDRLEETCRTIMSRVIVRLESEVALQIKMKVARDKAMHALSQSNQNMEVASDKMRENLEKVGREHAKRIEELQDAISQVTRSKRQATREHESALLAVESKYALKFDKLGKKSEELLTDFESHMQERIDNLGFKLDKKAARIRTLQRLLTHQLKGQVRERGSSSRILWFPVLLVILAAPILALFGKADRQWVCAPVPPWETTSPTRCRHGIHGGAVSTRRKCHRPTLGGNGIIALIWTGLKTSFANLWIKESHTMGREIR